MVLTWRAAACAGVTVLVVAVVGSWWAVLACALVLIAVIGIDMALCVAPDRVRTVRGGDTAIRLGETASTGCATDL